ncbi:MAG: alpha/beta hydrolase [Candidatus Sumerlaeota bacterium]|nr:alpha/beta hydrolase [Candidatus Sumerlaeota bacterium]
MDKSDASMPAPVETIEKGSGERDKVPPTFADVSYGPHERNVLDFWQANSDLPAPAFVWFHGGGYRNGDKAQFPAALQRRCLESGISFASANYRLTPEVQYPDPMLDGARAVQFLRAKAAEWRLDPERIAAGGSSAGAQISLWIGCHDDQAQPRSGDPVARQSSRLRCVLVVQMTWPVDPRDISKVAPLSAADGAGIKPLFGLPPAWDWEENKADAALDARLKDAALVNHVKPGSPPVFILHYAKNDVPGNIHNPAFGRYFKGVCDKAGIECIHHLDSDYENLGAAYADITAFLKKQLQ